MEELLLLVIGASALALSPIVPSLRPAAKAAVKGGLAVSDGARAAVAVAGQQLEKARSRSKANGQAAAADAAPADIPADTPGGEVASHEATAEPTQARDGQSEPTVDIATGAAQAEIAPAMPSPDDAPEPGLIDVDGIGPKVVGVLEAAGITTLNQLANMDEMQLREILASAGPRYRLMNPSSWPEQARQLLERTDR